MQELRVPDKGRNKVIQPQPGPAISGVPAARELNNATSELLDSLSFRLLQLHTIGDPEAEAIVTECERALVEIRAELEAIAIGKRA